MYLYVFPDKTIKEVHSNITTADYLAVAQKFLKIIKYKNGIFYQLIKDENKFYWIPVRKAKEYVSQQGKIHQHKSNVCILNNAGKGLAYIFLPNRIEIYLNLNRVGNVIMYDGR